MKTEKELNESLVNPLKRLTWDEKIKDDYKWFRECTDYYISHSYIQGLGNSLMYSDVNKKESKEYWYNVLRDLYHNDISVSLYHEFVKSKFNKEQTTVTRVRDLNMIKSNIDFIGSNFRKRKFNWSVSNTDSNSYNEFQESFKENLLQEVSKRFTQLINNEDGTQKPVDLTPKLLKAKFSLSYKDDLAVDYQQYLTNVINQANLHEKSSEMFIDYLIYGEPISYTSINEEGRLDYRRVDKRFFRYNKSNSEKYIKYSEWQVEIEFLTITDIVNKYYKELDTEKYEDVAINGGRTSQFENFYNSISGFAINNSRQGIFNKVPVYHVYWQSRKKVKRITYYEEGVLVEKEVSEEYKTDKTIEKEEIFWKNCIYKTDKIGKFYYEMGEYLYDCSDLSDSQKCLMPYNGFTFGHYYDDKVYSVLKLGVPYLISFLICHYMIDRLLIKNKGKIFLMDYNAIPNKNGWNLEKFLRYSEELGYAFIDRSQNDVDKSYNQYVSIDMSTLGYVFELINLSKSYQDLWDNIISVPRQLKGQSFASDEVGTTKSAVVQSGITIDYIYQKFDDFMNSDMQTILEMGKYIIINNKHDDIAYSDDGIKLLNLDINKIIASKLRFIPVNNSEENSELEQLKEYAKINNQADPLTITEFITAKSISQLKEALTKIRLDMQEQEEQKSNQDQERQVEMENMQKEIKQFEEELAEKLDTFQTDNKIRLANMTLQPDLKVDLDKDGIPDIIEANNKLMIENRKLDIKERQTDINSKQVTDNKEIEMSKIKHSSQSKK
jgi:hypothetical protein